VSIDLAADQQGRILTLNGRDVTAFSVFNDAFAKVSLELPEGLDADQNCVMAEYWPAAEPDDVSTITWCFTAA
jgi:hypothetical protein